MGTYTRSESSIRRLADREGYRLVKLRGDCGYWLIDLSTGGLVIGEERGVRIGHTLDVIEEFLAA